MSYMTLNSNESLKAGKYYIFFNHSYQVRLSDMLFVVVVRIGSMYEPYCWLLHMKSLISLEILRYNNIYA